MGGFGAGDSRFSSSRAPVEKKSLAECLEDLAAVKRSVDVKILDREIECAEKLLPAINLLYRTVQLLGSKPRAEIVITRDQLLAIQDCASLAGTLKEQLEQAKQLRTIVSNKRKEG